MRQPGGAYSDDDRAELLAEIEEEADRLDRLVGNLLDASRLEAGVMRPRKGPQDLTEVIAGAVQRLRPLLDGRDVVLDIQEGLPYVACDHAHLDQVVGNLVENAAIHTQPPGRILVRATRHAEGALVEVADQGPGIAPWDRDRIFRAFERGPTAARGSGLGLTIARGLIEANGGRLWVEDAEHRGARFLFMAPLWGTSS